MQGTASELLTPVFFFLFFLKKKKKQRRENYMCISFAGTEMVSVKGTFVIAIRYKFELSPHEVGRIFILWLPN
jgi:hypothetical protein